MFGALAVAIVLVAYWERTPPVNLPPEKSIAVLPFENLSDNKNDSYFVAGVQYEILTDLARIADLKVISRNSTRPYQPCKPRNSRQIGKQLGVAHLLECSVQRSNNRLRINAQLIDARTYSHLCADLRPGSSKIFSPSKLKSPKRSLLNFKRGYRRVEKAAIALIADERPGGKRPLP